MASETIDIESRVLLLPPTIKDGEITHDLLTKAGVHCVVLPNVHQLSESIERGAGAVFLTEEVLIDASVEELLTRLNSQPSWSDLPLVMMMRGGSQSPVVERVLHALRNVTLLERPAPMRSVVSAVQAAVRGRQRQYQIRDQIKAIREGEQRFEAMANSISQLAWMARPDGWLFWYNQRWHDYCGSTPQQMEGQGWQCVHDPHELPRVIEKWKIAVERGEPWEDTFPLRRHDGAFRWHLSRAMPFRDGSGKVQLWFGTNTDITEARQAADERERLLESERAARAEAERVSRIKDEFLATLSHELRTPLNAIYGWTQILKRGKGDPELVSEGVEVIDRNVRMQTTLIEDLLDMSRIIAGKVRLDIQRVELGEVIDAAIAGVKPAADAKRIRLERSFDPTLETIMGDPARLQQVFWNLLTNAIKFTPLAGTIRVAVQRMTSFIDIDVTDTGEGISPDFLPQVFQRFSQADGSTKRKHGGLGLGLSIVKNLVEMHGGTIRATSDGVGQGATFIVRLPLEAVRYSEEPSVPLKAATTNNAENESTLLKLTGVKVLVVDDEPDAREIIRRFLVEYEAVPVLAASVAEALGLLDAFNPDVILSDISMPDHDGYEFILDVRKRGRDTPAVAVTAFARAEDYARSIQAGFQTHISKPIKPAELVTAIGGLIKKR